MGFEEIIALIEAGKIEDVVDHPNPEGYQCQRIYRIDVNGYIYLVPFMVEKNVIFLKTIFPSRMATKSLRGARSRS